MGFGLEGRWIAAGPPSGRRFVNGIINGMIASRDPRTFDLVVFTTGSGRVPLPFTARRLPRLPAPLFNSLAIQVALPADVRAVLYQSFAPARSRAGRVVMVHDLIYQTRPEFFTPAERMYFSLIPRLMDRAEVIATVTQHVRQQILEQLPHRDPFTVAIIPNGVDDRFFRVDASQSETTRRAHDLLGASHPYLLAVGRINPRKNLARLVRAFLRSDLRDHLLVLAGPSDGPRDQELEAALQEAGDRVRLLGPVSDGALAALYATADVACYVSLDEGFGVPPLEAMAAQTPVLASAIPSVREVVADAALLVDPLDVDAISDGLVRLLYDEELRRRLVDKGRRRAEQYRWSTAAIRALDALTLAADLRQRS